jgi:hypothetical protein
VVFASAFVPPLPWPLATRQPHFDKRQVGPITHSGLIQDTGPLCPVDQATERPHARARVPAPSIVQLSPRPLPPAPHPSRLTLHTSTGATTSTGTGNAETEASQALLACPPNPWAGLTSGGPILRALTIGDKGGNRDEGGRAKGETVVGLCPSPPYNETDVAWAVVRYVLIH